MLRTMFVLLLIFMIFGFLSALMVSAKSTKLSMDPDPINYEINFGKGKKVNFTSGLILFGNTTFFSIDPDYICNNFKYGKGKIMRYITSDKP